jgi:predicted ATP-dependent endonuclease of OLD family
MKITKFDIRNFKGISHTTVHLSDDAPGNVTTLIGLNESGKTTILEAISHFVTEDKDTASLVGTVQKRAVLQDLIPKDRKAAFTGHISVKATIRLDESDLDELAGMFLSKFDLVLDRASLPRESTLEKVYEFQDSSHKKTHTWWSLTFDLRTKKAKKFTTYGSSTEGSSERTTWLAGVNLLRERVPKIVYFPTFLFEFPNRIYLEGDDTEINAYYMQIIQDVLDSQGEGLDVKRHIIDRIDKVRDEHGNSVTFFSHFFHRDERRQIDAVLQKASNEMSRVIFGSWSQVLGRGVTGKRVQIEWMIDGDRDNAPYLELAIVDGPSKYSLSERSLGFRWFFSFLLFTQFRKNRTSDKSTIFLFDEPAANLHSKAQIKLLESFSRIATDSTYIIYSTHSHYMVDPLWLERAYIVENKTTDYDSLDDVDSFAIRKTDIRAVRYRRFVGSNPARVTYYQPVLDALDVAFSPLERSSHAIIVEGKNDLYPIMYFGKRRGGLGGVGVFPSNGAGSAGCLVSLFRGWGADFRIILDDDQAGKQAKKKYLQEFLLREIEVATLADITPTFAGLETEDLYRDDVRTAVRARYGVEIPSKRQYSLFFQELLSLGASNAFPETEAVFEALLSWIDLQFGIRRAD